MPCSPPESSRARAARRPSGSSRAGGLDPECGGPGARPHPQPAEQASCICCCSRAEEGLGAAPGLGQGVGGNDPDRQGWGARPVPPHMVSAPEGAGVPLLRSHCPAQEFLGGLLSVCRCRGTWWSREMARPGPPAHWVSTWATGVPLLVLTLPSPSMVAGRSGRAENKQHPDPL